MSNRNLSASQKVSATKPLSNLVRRAKLADLPSVSEMCHCLWPESSVQDHAAEMAPLLTGTVRGNLPGSVLVAEEPIGTPVGFIHVGLRSHADGCDPSHPVGLIEGWYVDPGHRRQGIGTRLVRAAEQWARDQGCIEMASDTWIDHAVSQRAHEALGFEIVDRCVHYRKPL